MAGQRQISLGRLGIVLFLTLAGQSIALSQAGKGGLAAKIPEIEGIYEIMVPGTGPDLLQVFFVDGELRTISRGSSGSTKWRAVEGETTRFESANERSGTYRLDFLKDEQGRLTKFRVVNDAAKYEALAAKKANLDDAKADPASPSERQGYFERHYRKSEHRIPMRDGIRLFTQVYSPIDQSERHPIILCRTPYGIPPYGKDFRNQMFPGLPYAKENYILIFQDIRGMSMSEGKFEFLRPYRKDKKTPDQTDESSDAYDTVEWALRNIPGHNGKVGVWGISYPGFTAAMAAISSHPAVLAVSPQAPMADLFLGDDGHHSGALYLAHYANYIYTMGQSPKAPTPDPLPRLSFPTPDGYAFFLRLGPLKNITAKIFGATNAVWNDAMAHETYDAYWKEHSIYPHLGRIKPAILNVGGWYDAEDLLGTLLTYKTIERENPGLQNTIVMGPWFHSGWNPMAGGSENRGVFPFDGTRAYFQEKLELPFFNYYLKGKGPLPLPEAAVFETGTDQWRAYGTWPPADARDAKMRFSSGGRLAFEPGPESPTDPFDEFVSDPAKPVPYTLQTTARYNREYLVEDQRFAASRPDVLVYAGEPLAEDITICGPIKAELYVSTSGTDADWVVKVIDVYPDDAPDPKTNPGNIRMGGYQRLIRGDVIRGKFREGFEKPKPFVPNQATKVEFELPDVQHAFLKGHRIMVQIQSSWFPLIDRNPQTFCDIRTADESDFRKATHRLYRSGQYPSGIRFKVLPKEAAAIPSLRSD